MAEYKSQHTGAQIDEAVDKVLNGEAGSGTDGFSPVANVQQTDDGAVLTVTDKTGTTRATVSNGVSPTVDVSKSGKVTTLTITDATGTKTATINDGEDGADGTGDGSTAVPAYVTAEAERVVEAINAARTSQSLVLLCASDIHTVMTSNAATSTIAQSKETTLHLAQGINEICKRVTVDGVAILGDIVTGGPSSTIQECKDELDYLRVNLGSTQGIPQIWLEGNHDHNSQNSAAGYLTADELYARIGANTTDKAVTDYDNLHRMYGYVDYDRQKIRVIYLNTADITDSYASDYGVTTVQLQWLVDTLKDVQSGWGVVVTSHHPLNTSAGAATVVLTILDAFKGKQSGSVSSVSYDFSNAQGELICHLHGHIHNYQAQTFGTNGVLSITIPNGSFWRNNEYGTGGNTAWGDADASGKQRVFAKTAGTAEDTAYTAVIIDRKNGVVHALRCGAGIDRTLAYSENTVLYKVTTILTNVTSSNTATDVVGGAAYTTTLTANAGYTLDTVEVFMGSTDITATAYVNGKVTIAEVTGAIIIGAKAVATGGGDSGDTDNENNLVPTAQAMDSTAVYNGSGYKDDYRLSTDSPYESAAAGYVATGLIPYSVPDTGVPGTIYIKGADWNEVSNCRMLFFDASKAITYPQIKGGATGNNGLVAYYTLETLGDKYYKLTPIVDSGSSTGNWTAIGITSRVQDAEFFRISLAGSGSGLVITVDKPIE